MVVATAIKDYIANTYCGGTTHLNGVMNFNEDCALNRLIAPLPSGYTHEGVCTPEHIEWAYNNIGYTPAAPAPPAPPAAPPLVAAGEIGILRIVEAAGAIIGVLYPPHTLPTVAEKGSTARFGISVTTRPRTVQAGQPYSSIQVKAKVRIIHSSLTPEFSGESFSTTLSIGAVATLEVAITIPTTAKTGNYNVYAEAFTLA